MSSFYIVQDITSLLDQLNKIQHEQLYIEINKNIPSLLEKGEEDDDCTKINSTITTVEELRTLKKIIEAIIIQ